MERDYPVYTETKIPAGLKRKVKERKSLDTNALNFVKVCGYSHHFDVVQKEALFADLLKAYVWKTSAPTVDCLLRDDLDGFNKLSTHMNTVGSTLKETLAEHKE